MWLLVFIIDIVFPLKHVLYFRAAERFLIRLKYLTKKARKVNRFLAFWLHCNQLFLKEIMSYYVILQLLRADPCQRLNSGLQTLLVDLKAACMQAAVVLSLISASQKKIGARHFPQIGGKIINCKG